MAAQIEDINIRMKDMKESSYEEHNIRCAKDIGIFLQEQGEPKSHEERVRLTQKT